MKPDLQNRQDVETLVNAFYEQVQDDEVIGYMFQEVAQVDWPTHLPRMYSFWESVLWGKRTFKGNPMETHIHLNKKERFSEAHFERWIALWERTIDAHFAGETADEAKRRAHSIRNIMAYKLKANP